MSKVFTDKASGKDTQRPQLEALLSFVREGDTVVVHSMDRLARNLDDLRRLVQKLTQRGVRIEFLKEGLVFTGEDSPMANLMLSVMGAFAEFERALIREQQRYRASGLNLVTAAIVLWNTVYLERATQGLVEAGKPVDGELLQFLSPLGWEHINLTGDYVWRQSRRLEDGKFRPLRMPGKP
ncbi:Transposon resolvase (plasmid) [Aeromonas rivipollensis]